MKKSIFRFYAIMFLFLQGSLMSLAVAQDGEREKMEEIRCCLFGTCSCEESSESQKEPQASVTEEPVASSAPFSMENNGEEPECSIDVNFEQVKCDKSYDELKRSWQSLKQDFENTSKSVLRLHEVVNQDEMRLDLDKCGCYLIECEQAYNQSPIAEINNLLEGIKHFHSCLSQMNKRMLENPLVLELVSDSMLSDINNLIGLSYERIVKVCSFREYRIPKYKEYIEKLSKGCKMMGRTPDVVGCQN